MNNQPQCKIDEHGEHGSEEWRSAVKWHREGIPAVECANKQPVCKIDECGTKEWILNGKTHREDGPAIEYEDGGKYWFINGKMHREDGPAAIVHGYRKEWYLDGKEVQPEDVVDYNLAKGIFCYYDDQEQELKFGEQQ